MEKEKYEVFNTPKYVYLSYDSIEKLSLRKSGAVYLSEFLGTMGITNIYSTVSGKIIGTKKVNVNNSLTDALVIENDYKNKYFKIKTGKENYDFYKRKDANTLFNLFNIDGKFNGKKYLMIDLTVKNNYRENKYIVDKYNYEILETIEAMLKIFNIKNAYVAVNDSYVENLLSEYSGIYPNIKFVSNIITNEYSVLYSGYDILRIYNALKFNRAYSYKYVTIINKKNAIVVKTNLGVEINEILLHLNMTFNKINVITYDNEKIENYNGILSSTIKTIVIE